MSATLTRNDTTAAEFATIVQRLVTRASRERPQLADRLERAGRIVLRDDQPIVHYADGTATVRAESSPEAVYQVDGPRCSCLDALHRERLCKHAIAAGLDKRARREARDDANRRASYGRTYVAPGTPGAFAACRACGVTAVLDDFGLCPECAAERFVLTVAGEAALRAVVGVA